MAFIWGLLSTCIIIGVGFAVNFKTLTYVPFKHLTSGISEVNENQFVTTKDHYSKLKWFYPDIKRIDSLDALSNHDIVILPWNSMHPNLQFMPIDDTPFYMGPSGTIQIKAFTTKTDTYNDFLSNRITVTAGGTVVLARGVHKLIEKKNDVTYPWKNTRHLFFNSDINMVNFKSPLVSAFTYPESSWHLVGKSSYAKGMQTANIHIVSIAGNHMGDAKIGGLIETIDTLHHANIETVGAGDTLTEAYRCKRIQRKKTTFGFLAFNNVPGSVGKASMASPGIAWLDNDALRAIKDCDREVDQLLVMVNWGIEYTHTPRKHERLWAKRMIDAGADIIIGDQAHWVQAHEKINGKHVSYGLGNYIFDQHWSQETTEGIIQTYVFYNEALHTIHTVPIKLYRDGKIKEVSSSSPRYLDVLNAYYDTSNLNPID